MPRSISTQMLAALQAPLIRPALLVELNFASGPVYVWSGRGPLIYNGATYSGLGEFGSVTGVSEDSTIEAKGVTFTLSGVSSYLVKDTLDEFRILGKAYVYLALFDDSNRMIPSPIAMWQGKLDKPSISDDGEHSVITISAENVFVDLNRACYRRYTDGDQQMDLAATLTKLGLPASTTDTGFSHVPCIQEASVFWGSTPHGYNT